MSELSSATEVRAGSNIAEDGDHNNGITQALVPPGAPGYSCISIHAYGAEPDLMLNADAFEVADNQSLKGAASMLFVYVCTICGSELLIVRSDYDDGHSILFAFEHAPSMEWFGVPVPATIAVAHAEARGDHIETPLGIVSRNCQRLQREYPMNHSRSWPLHNAERSTWRRQVQRRRQN